MRMTLRSGDLPVGQKTVQPRLQKYSCFVPTQITSLITPSRPTEGRFAVVTNAGRDAVDADSAIDERHEGGRRSRVVLTPRRWCQVRGGISANDGGKRARSPGRARYKPLKPLRAGMPGCSGGPVVTNARVYYTPRAAAGASGARHSLRPLIGGQGNFRQTSGVSGREIAKPCLKSFWLFEN